MSGDPARLGAYEAVSAALAGYDERELSALLDSGTPLGSGVGGRTVLLEVGGRKVFAKRVPLTEPELRPEHLRSTANVFGLPTFCHYGIGAIGGAGFGGWREVAAHTVSTDWVRAGEHQGFPLMYHWRVLPDPEFVLPEELADIERAVAYWGGGAGVRSRIEALRDSSAGVVLFLEYVPQTLHAWLNEQVRAGDEAVDRACAFVERELESTVAFMNDRGLLHFDAHFENILTDGRRLYFTDFGLAQSSRFDLSPAEADFFDRNRTHDRAYTLSFLVNWLITNVYGYARTEREALLHACAEGKRPPAGPEGVRSLLARHAPLAAPFTDFCMGVRDESREVPYPHEAIERIFAAPPYT